MSGSTRASFHETLTRHGTPLGRSSLRSLQLNLGARCELSCTHCHVSAGPARTESMTAATADLVSVWIVRHRPAVVDLTGGEPELCSEFRRLVVAARTAGAEIVVRSNLVTLLAPQAADLPAFFAAHQVRVTASMPCYLEENVDAQRGKGVYARSIAALRLLNAAGYGREPSLRLDLVYNPGGATLPPPQADLESDYRRELRSRHGIEFSRLLCLANMPIGRFAERLRSSGEADAYQALLAHAFNPEAVAALMCRDTLSVSHTGALYDCDFNQMAGLPLGNGPIRRLWDVDPETHVGASVATAPHCFGCTAGTGSGCGGALV